LTNIWIDTNVIIRFVAKDSEQSRRIARLMRRAQDGEVALRVPSIVIAEAVWVLDKVYGFERTSIADALRSFVLADGVVVDDREAVVDGLRLMALQKVAFPDAHLAALARSRGEPIASFDTDFRRLGVELVALPS